jgi:hypothetical protein
MRKPCKNITSSLSTIERLESRLLLAAAVREVTGTVFQDLNTSWVQDAGESPFPGLTIYDDVNGMRYSTMARLRPRAMLMGTTV